MASGPIVIKVPPAPSGKGKAVDPLTKFLNSHPGMGQYGQTIYNASKAYGVNPLWIAAIIWQESRGKNIPYNPAVGGAGIAQINIGPGHNSAPDGGKYPGGVVDPMNQVESINFLAYQIAKHSNTIGDPDTFYKQVWKGAETPANPGPGHWLKGYPVYTKGATPPPLGAQGDIAKKGAKQDLTDPWVVLTKQGTFKSVTSPNPPKGTITEGGFPVRVSDFNKAWKNAYQDTWVAYTGKQATPRQIAQVLASSVSVTTLASQLAGASPNPYHTDFTKSPVYKKSAPGLVSYARTILGNNWKPSGGIIRQAIAQNWDQATFYSHLRSLPAYQQGPEFKTNLAQNQAAFESTYGTVSSSDPSIQALIKQKTLDGWTPDEFKSWLEQQPAYKHSAAWQTKTLSFLSQLGLITGAVPTLSGDQVDQMMNLNLGQQQAAPTTGGNANAGAVGAGVARGGAAGPRPAPPLVSEHGQGGGFR